jgi:hypothetical protein
MWKAFVAVLMIHASLVACSPKEEKKEDGAASVEVSTINDYPDIMLRLADGSETRAKSLQGNNVFVLFQPDCDHCQEEAIQIGQRLEEFKDYSLYFISSAPMEQITRFAETFELDNKENVKFAWTTTEGVLDNYGPIPTPSVYIYSDGRLKRSFNGQTNIETILSVL